MKQILALSLLLAACQSPTNPAKQQAIAALKIPVTSDFPAYIEKVASAKQAMDTYQVSGKADKDVLNKMQNALDAHIAAGNFWQCSLSAGEGVIRQCQTQQLKAIAENYSSVKPYADELKGQVPDGYAFSDVNKEKVLGTLWAEADKEVAAIK